MARPVPIIFMRPLELEHEAAEDDDHDRGRGGDDLGRGGQAVGDRRAAVAGAVPLLADPGEQEHLVVHRQAEHDGEQHHRHPRLDRARLHAGEVAEPAPLEQGDDRRRRRRRSTAGS